PLSNVRALYWSRRKRKTTQEEEDCFECSYVRNSLDWSEPDWFSKETLLVSSRGKDKPEWLEDYIAIIRHAVSAMYNPHIVARQLGYDQDAPFPLVHGFDSKGIKVWVPGICRRGIASKEYVARLNDEFATGSSPLDADTAAGKSGESTMQDNRKRTREKQQLAQEEKLCFPCDVSPTRSPCYMDSSATSMKIKNGNRKRRDELCQNGDMHKKITPFASECHEGLQQYDDGPSTVGYPEKNSLQFDGHKSHGLQKDPNYEDGQLVLELQEFVRCGLFSQWEESFDEDEDEGGEGKKEMPKKSNIDPYAEAVMSEYPLFFELIPERPHYKGLVNTSDTIRDLACRGLWFLFVLYTFA
ncbi:hypothetical protein ZWY2020_032138, partial [Hordeum vulgare]